MGREKHFFGRGETGLTDEVVVVAVVVVKLFVTRGDAWFAAAAVALGLFEEERERMGKNAQSPTTTFVVGWAATWTRGKYVESSRDKSDHFCLENKTGDNYYYPSLSQNI
jgi:hypothetical protein